MKTGFKYKLVYSLALVESFIANLAVGYLGGGSGGLEIYICVIQILCLSTSVLKT